jgi:mRNA-degrading endonuclease toxin of MazEF toxin-antitoxin module
LVLSEDDYNAVTRDVVIVPIFADEATETSDAVVRISATHIAHCTRITTVLQEDLALDRECVPCPGSQLHRIEQGVSGYLALQRLVEGSPPPVVRTTRTAWWPRQGDIRYAPLEAAAGAKKMFAILSEDDWNSRPGSTHSTGAKLTSKSRAPEHWRAPLEVPVAGGGVVVAGHLYLLPHTAIDPKAPNAPRPSTLEAQQLAELAARSATVLGL